MAEAGPSPEERTRRNGIWAMGGAVAGAALAPFVELLAKDFELPLWYGPRALAAGLGFIAIYRIHAHLTSGQAESELEVPVINDYAEAGQQG